MKTEKMMLNACAFAVDGLAEVAAAGPQAPLEEGLALGGDLVHALDRIKRAHVERDREQLYVHRGLGDGVQRGRIDRLELGVSGCAGAAADGAWHGRSSLRGAGSAAAGPRRADRQAIIDVEARR
jgi:hypothetical protein